MGMSVGRPLGRPEGSAVTVWVGLPSADFFLPPPLASATAPMTAPITTTAPTAIHTLRLLLFGGGGGG